MACSGYHHRAGPYPNSQIEKYTEIRGNGMGRGKAMSLGGSVGIQMESRALA
jgi:hypothetical protein